MQHPKHCECIICTPTITEDGVVMPRDNAVKELRIVLGVATNEEALKIALEMARRE
jgi:hypothetical protein